MTTVILGAAVGFVVCLLAMFSLRPVAVAVDLVDRPGGHKTHHGEVPIVGGIAMFLGLAVGVGLVPAGGPRVEALIGACALLVTIGMLDDRFNISPWLRLPVQAAATLLVVLSNGAGMVLTLGNPFGTGEVVFTGLAAYAVLLTFVGGAVNAFNMLDGMDGLAGAVSAIALAGLCMVAQGAGLTFTLHVGLVLAGAVAAFLLFNFPTKLNRRVRSFMGDAGSTLIGFVLALMALRLTQGKGAPIAPVFVLWLVALPIYELLWTMIRRLSRGHSPFRPDREHFHHLLLDAGFSVRGAFTVYLTLAALVAILGMLMREFGLSDAVAFYVFCAIGVGVVLTMYRAAALLNILSADWWRRDVPAAG